jgi:hypothetical protein
MERLSCTSLSASGLPPSPLPSYTFAGLLVQSSPRFPLRKRSVSPSLIPQSHFDETTHGVELQKLLVEEIERVKFKEKDRDRQRERKRERSTMV